MNTLIFLAIFGLSSAAQLPSRNYIPQGQDGGYQNFQPSHGSGHIGGGGSGGTRPQQQAEKNAAIVKQELEIGEEGSNYNFGYETSNGIRAEEVGNPAQAQGGFAYKGDDGHVYTVTYTAGEGGFRPQGEHLPVPPPTPEAILEALKQNEKDEAAGIFDDGKYRPDVHGGGQNGGQGAGGHFGSTGHQGGFNANTGYQY